MGVVERLSFDTVSSRTLIASEHVHRYELAARLCGGLSVVDLACGVGYGSEILLGTARSVLGVDNDAATVDSARAAYRDREGLSFAASDVNEFLRSPDARAAEAIVCFEGLEHFPHPDETLAILAELGRAGARIVLSVPNSRAFEEDNPHHVTDYGYETAMEAFEALGASQILFQFLAEGSLIRTRQPNGVDGRFVLDEHGEPEYANHFIGLVNVGEAEPEGHQDGRMQLEMAPLHNRFVRHLQRANRELWQANARLSRAAPGTFDSAAASLLNRVREAEERASAADDRERVAEESIRLADDRVRAADERVRAAEDRVGALEADRDLWHEEADRLQAVRADLEQRFKEHQELMQRRLDELEAVRSRKAVRLVLGLSRLLPRGR